MGGEKKKGGKGYSAPCPRRLLGSIDRYYEKAESERTGILVISVA